MNGLSVSRIKVVFFDIGGLLLSKGWGHELRQKAAEVFGFDYEEMNAILHQNYETTTKILENITRKQQYYEQGK
ncbi:MAG: hypothetical protein ACOH1N_03580 [Lutibacter sp.]